MRPLTVVVTGAGGAAGRNVIASLLMSNKPYRIVGVDADATFLPASGANDVHVVPRADDSGYISALSNIVAEEDVDVLHAQPDVEVKTLSESGRGVLPVSLPPRDAINIASDKYATHEALQRAGMPVPLAVLAGDRLGARFAEMRERGGGRVWVRARSGAGAKASLSASTELEACAWIDYWKHRGLRREHFMLSQFLPGREFAVQTLWWAGDLIAAQARERLEYLFGYLTPSGQTSSPSVATIVNRHDVYESALQAVRAISPKPHGIYSVDLKCDDADRPFVTEINAGRFFTTSLYMATLGVNFPEMFVQLAAGEAVRILGVGPIPEQTGLWIRSVDMWPMLVPER